MHRHFIRFAQKLSVGSTTNDEPSDKYWLKSCHLRLPPGLSLWPFPADLASRLVSVFFFVLHIFFDFPAYLEFGPKPKVSNRIGPGDKFLGGEFTRKPDAVESEDLWVGWVILTGILTLLFGQHPLGCGRTPRG